MKFSSVSEVGFGKLTIGALIEMVCIAALSGISLWILQVPLALAHALLAGLLNFIPNIEFNLMWCFLW